MATSLHIHGLRIKVIIFYIHIKPMEEISNTNSSATGREACISFDPPSFGKAFYAVDNRDNSTEATTTYGPALFVGTSNGYVRRFRNNNGTGSQERRYNSLATLGI